MLKILSTVSNAEERQRDRDREIEVERQNSASTRQTESQRSCVAQSGMEHVFS